MLLTLGLLLIVGPFVWMLLGSLKTQAELVAGAADLAARAIGRSDNYSRLFTKLDFPRYFLNSAVIAGSITLANLVFCSMVGYALAKLRFAGRDKLFLLVLAHDDGARQRDAGPAVRADERSSGSSTRTGR